jgi:uncharacterized protein (TIGR04141 family)
MSRKKSDASRTSLYRLLGVPSLAAAVQDKYLKHPGFTATSPTVGKREALLVSGTMTTDKVSWATTLTGLTAEPVDLGNQTAAAVLIIREGTDNGWALAYGMGFQLLNQNKVDGGFGQRIAIRTADPRDLNSLTRTTLDHRSRTDRFSIPSGDHLRGFGVGDYGEVVTRLVAKAELKSLTGGNKPIRIRGADALSVPLGKKPDQLLSDLDELTKILGQKPAADLAVLEQLVAITRRPDLIEQLEADLDVALGDPGSSRLSLSWPHERIDENGSPTSFKVYGAGRRESKPRDGIPELETLVALVAKSPATKRVTKLQGIKLMLYKDSDASDPISPLIPALKWLAFETDRDGKRYCLHDGRWYLMDEDYAKKLRDRTQAIFDLKSGIVLPDWPAGLDEAAYNQLAADALGGIVLDQQLIRTEMHRRGIEVCDVLAPNGALIHVKDIAKSSPASHLLAQALVSADALLHDEQARSKLRDLVTAKGGDPSMVKDRTPTVILGMARQGKALTADNLFTFTQVTLARQVALLRSQGVDVFIVPINRL